MTRDEFLNSFFIPKRDYSEAEEKVNAEHSSILKKEVLAEETEDRKILNVYFQWGNTILIEFEDRYITVTHTPEDFVLKETFHK